MISLGDGFGSDYDSVEKASEDFLTLDGKVYKLDITEMNYTKNDYLQPKTLRTM